MGEVGNGILIGAVAGIVVGIIIGLVMRQNKILRSAQNDTRAKQNIIKEGETPLDI